MIANIDYHVAGRMLSGALVRPSSNVRAGVLVLHGGSGVTDHERGVALRLAERGYVAFAPDLFGERFADREHGVAARSCPFTALSTPANRPDPERYARGSSRAPVRTTRSARPNTERRSRPR